MRTVSMLVGSSVFLAAAPAAVGQVEVRFEQPRQNATRVSTAAIESFIGVPAGDYGPPPQTPGFVFGGNPSVGSYSTAVANGMKVRPADLNGGAGGTGNYLQLFNADSVATIDVADPFNAAGAGYFGLYVTAGNDSNQISFQRSLEGGGYRTVSTFNMTTLLSNGQLRRDLANPGSAESHYGNPEPGFVGQNPNEVYVYLNFYAETDSDRFDRIVLTGIGFESDNHALNNELIATGDRTGTVVSLTPVPEPAGLLTLGGLVLAARLRRRGVR